MPEMFCTSWNQIYIYQGAQYANVILVLISVLWKMCFSGPSGVRAWIHRIVAGPCLLFYISKTYHQNTPNTPGFQFYKLLQTSRYVSKLNWESSIESNATLIFWKDSYKVLSDGSVCKFVTSDRQPEQNLCYLRFSQQCCWLRIRSSEMWCSVPGEVFSDISKEHNVLIFSIQQSKQNSHVES